MGKKNIDQASGKLLPPTVPFAATVPLVQEEVENVIPATLRDMRFKEKLADVPISKLKMDLDRNKRDRQTAYDFKKNMKNKADLATMLTTGIMPGFRVLVHQNTMDLQGNEDIQVIDGHRRVHLCKEAGFPLVPCLVITGATNDQILNMIQNPPPQDPGKIGRLKALENMIRSGQTDKASLCTRCEIAPSDLQEYRTILRLPVSYRQMWESYQRQKTKNTDVLFTPTRDATLALFAEQTADEKGCPNDQGKPTKPPVLTPEGPRYKALFDSFCLAGVVPKNKVNATSLIEYAAGIPAHPTVQAMVRGLAKMDGVDRESAIAKVMNVTDTFERLQALAKRLDHPALSALIDGPEGDDDVQRAAKLEAIATVFVNAYDHFIGLHPDRDPLIVKAPAVKAPAVKAPAVKAPAVK